MHSLARRRPHGKLGEHRYTGASDAYSRVRARGHVEIPLTAGANSANSSRRSPNFAIIANRHAANLIEPAALSFLDRDGGEGGGDGGSKEAFKAD